MVFVDTSFLFAYSNVRDSRHRDATAIIGELGGSGFVTTNHVLGESWTLAGRRFGHHAAVRLVESVRVSARCRVHHVGADAEGRAFDWLARHDEREYSFVDATSFETMRELRISTALAFDADFEAAGFQTVRP